MIRNLRTTRSLGGPLRLPQRAASKRLLGGILVTCIAALANTPAGAARSEAERAAVITASDCIAREVLAAFSRNNDANWEDVPAWGANASPSQQGVLQELINAVLHASSASPSGTAKQVWLRFHKGVPTFANSCRNEIDRMIKVHDQFHGNGNGRIFFTNDYRDDLPRAVYERIKSKLSSNSLGDRRRDPTSFPQALPGTEKEQAEIRPGRCRGFVSENEVGMMIEPEPEGEGAAPCRFTQGSVAAAKIRQTCSYGWQCEIVADLDKEGNVVEVTSVAMVGGGFAGTCRGSIRFEGDDSWQAGFLYGANKGNIPCSFSSSLASGSRILDQCPEGSVCEISAKFEHSPPQDVMSIGHVTSVRLLRPPTLPRDDLTDNAGRSDTSTPLGLCSAAVSDPLRHMLIDVFISGGKHLGDMSPRLKGDIERDYGAFLTIKNDATVERVDGPTGKVACKVTYEMDMQGLAAKVLEEGANRRAEVLIQQMRQYGKLLRRRLEYTVQKSSGSWMVWLGSVLEQPARIQRRGTACLIALGGQCAFWLVR